MSKPNKQYKAIFVDKGGVATFGGFPVFCPILAEILDIPEKQVFEVFEARNFPLLTQHKITVRQYWKKCLDEVGRSDQFKKWPKFEQLVIKSYTINKGLLLIIDKLKKHYFIPILSNQGKQRKKYLNKNCHLSKYYAAFYMSSELGYNKSDPRFIKAILRRRHLKPEECILIDNQRKNLPTAKKMGLATIYYTSNKQLISDLKKIGVL